MAVSYATVRGADVAMQMDAVRGDYTLGKVAVVKTSPQTVLEDYARLMRMLNYQRILPKENPTILKINISWDKFYPACSTTPWQLEGVVKTMLEDGYDLKSLIPAQNRTVVVDAKKGAVANKHTNVAQKYGFDFVWLWEPQVEWVRYEPQAEMLVLDKVFEEGITIPKLFIGKNALHLPTMKCVHPETEVVLADGSLHKIGELVEGQLGNGGIPLFESDGDVRVQAQIPVLSLMPDGTIAPQETCWIWKTPVNGQKLWRVQTRTGREVTVSPEHPFLTTEGWKKASALQVGERIAIVRRMRVSGESQPLPILTSPNPENVDVSQLPLRDGRKFDTTAQRQMLQDYLNGVEVKTILSRYVISKYPFQRIRRRAGIPPRQQRNWAVRVPEKTSPDFWRWMGLLIAEGHIAQNNVFDFASSHPEIRREYMRLVDRLFGVKPQRFFGLNIRFRSVQLREFMERLGLPVPLNAGNKKVPSLLFKCPDGEVAAFLSGYLDGDGGVNKISQRDDYALSVTTKSTDLARGVQTLLSRFGVVAFRSVVWAKAANTDQPKQPYHALSVYGDDLKRLTLHLNLLHEQKRKNLQYFRSRHQDAGKSNWDKVPIPPEMFRKVQEGLGLKRPDMAHRGMLAAFEQGWRRPNRHIMHTWIEHLEARDWEGRFSEELSYFKTFLNEDIAWDSVTTVEQVSPDVPYLYDLSLDGSHSFTGNGFALHNTHVFTQMSCNLKNAFGGLLRENRHYCHSVIHQTLVDLLAIQREIHPGLFGVVDGTVSGKGPGPRAMEPVITNLLLGGSDLVAVDAIAAKMMGFDPMSLPFIRLAHERGLGVGDPQEIEVIGEDISGVNLQYKVGDTFASRGQKAIYHGLLKPFEKFLLRTPVLQVWSFWASHLYHNVFFWTKTGSGRTKEFLEKTEWGKLFQQY